MNWGRIYFGTLIVLVGVLLLLDSGDIVDAGSIIGDWWPAAILVAGVLSIVANPSHWPVGLIITAVGVTLLLSTLDVVDISSIIWPAIIILVGLVVLFGRGLTSRSESGDTINSFNVFSGSEIASRSQQFHGGSISALFGGAEVDLRGAMPAPEAKIDIFTAFGGVELRVPDTWQVIVRGLPIFGGFENVTAKEALAPDAPTLHVNATALFGGVEIKH